MVKLSLLFLFASSAFACNFGPPVSEGDCTLYSALTGSFATMTNSAYGKASGGVEGKVYTFNGALSLTAYEFRPKGLSTYANVPICPFTHGGGWNSGDATGAAVGVNVETTVRAPVEIVQITGCVYYAMNYRLTPGSAYPAQIQDVFCWLFEGIASTRDGNFNDIRPFGSSAGGNLTLLLTLLSTTDVTQSCPAATSTAYTITRVAVMSAVIHVAGNIGSYNAASSSYGNTCTSACGSVGLTAFQGLLNCSDASTCATKDSSLQESPLWWMVANNPRIKIPLWFGGGCIVDEVTGGAPVSGPCQATGANGDDLIQWNANQTHAITVLNALGIYPALWIGPSECYVFLRTAECKHQSDISKLFGLDLGGTAAQALPAALTFLFPTAGSITSGGSGTGDGSQD